VESIPPRTTSITLFTPRAPAGRQAPQVRAAEEHGPGSERERDHHVAAAADPAVEQHLDLVPDCGRDLRALLRSAVEAGSDDDGWTHLGSVGNIITQAAPRLRHAQLRLRQAE
jgi:hypothetical protein